MYHNGGRALTTDSRLQVDTGTFYNHAKLLLDRRQSIGQRLAAWATAPRCSALHNASSWTVCSTELQKVQTWELKRLRTMFKLRRSPNDAGQMGHMQRTALRLRGWMDHHGIAGAAETWLRLHFRWVAKALRKPAFGSSEAPSPLAQALRFQDRAWFARIEAEYALRDRNHEATAKFRHAAPGWRLSWVDSFVEWLGLHWKTWIESP